MRIGKRSFLTGSLGRSLLAATALSATAFAQDADPQAPTAPDEGRAPPGPTPQGVPTPAGAEAAEQAPSGGTVYTPPTGAAAADPNGGLPSSSRPSTTAGSFSDGFDLRPHSGGSVVVRGREGSAAVLDDTAEAPARIPEVHTVRRGDTLWGLSEHYHGNPWQWPRLWSYNPHVENPHWIYPGDQLRMRGGGSAGGAGSGGDARALTGSGGGFSDRRTAVPQDTVFLRNEGFIDDANRDNWGELVGSREEQMLLSEGNTVYLAMRPGAQVRPGQVLTVYRATPAPKRPRGARKVSGQVVTVKGSVRVDAFDTKTRVARARIVESVDAIERGAKIGSVGRRFFVVPPKPSTVTVRAHVLNSLYPHVYLAQNQIVFLDRGSKDGLEQGYRLVVIRRGDSWRESLRNTTGMARDRIVLDAPEHVRVERTPLRGDPKNFPEEIVGELRVLKASDHSSVALVTSSSKEIMPGDVAWARSGY
jgi:LysM repeat protein